MSLSSSPESLLLLLLLLQLLMVASIITFTDLFPVSLSVILKLMYAVRETQKSHIFKPIVAREGLNNRRCLYCTVSD